MKPALLDAGCIVALLRYRSISIAQRPQIRALMRRYANVPMDFAGACLVQMADELETGRILTLDADFAIYRWRRTRGFEGLLT